MLALGLAAFSLPQQGGLTGGVPFTSTSCHICVASWMATPRSQSGGVVRLARDSDHLFENAVSPVCSPALLAADPALREPRDLLRHPLIYVSWGGQDAQRQNWRKWLRVAGVNEFEEGLLSGLMTLDLHCKRRSTARDSSLVLDGLASGRLVQPFALSIAGLRNSPTMLCRLKTVADALSVRTFPECIVAEAEKSARFHSLQTPVF